MIDDAVLHISHLLGEAAHSLCLFVSAESRPWSGQVGSHGYGVYLSQNQTQTLSFCASKSGPLGHACPLPRHLFSYVAPYLCLRFLFHPGRDDCDVHYDVRRVVYPCLCLGSGRENGPCNGLCFDFSFCGHHGLYLYGGLAYLYLATSNDVTCAFVECQ